VTDTPDNACAGSTANSDFTLTEAYRLGRITFKDITSTNPLMMKCLDMAMNAAMSDISIVISGESGTGKNLFAQAIHNVSRRSEKPLISVNCSALPDTLLESELFGYKKGAFTGAESDRRGKFEIAHTGTLFLDEIGDLTHAAQAKMLRVVEYGQFERLGDEKTRKVDVRIIAATNKNLLVLVQKGEFRDDLLYRLMDLHIELPPLRDRREDVPLLARRFLREYNTKFGRGVAGFSEDVLHDFIAYNWPGNVRELKAVIKRALTLIKGTIITPADIELRAPAPDTPAKPDLDDADDDLSLNATIRKHIEKVLALTGANKSRTAQILGITRPTLDKKIRDLGIRL
jgi:transcriptional regulator with PAS, ATPase and Fis domain